MMMMMMMREEMRFMCSMETRVQYYSLLTVLMRDRCSPLSSKKSTHVDVLMSSDARIGWWWWWWTRIIELRNSHTHTSSSIYFLISSFSSSSSVFLLLSCQKTTRMTTHGERVNSKSDGTSESDFVKEFFDLLSFFCPLFGSWPLFKY